mmetsp:Transcript_15250/g.61296  ORF Transcript_15250/g.61296 Transcript_15250/m.61296 type:complete len:632 (-) Transcript_15250:332-2227(-)
MAYLRVRQHSFSTTARFHLTWAISPHSARGGHEPTDQPTWCAPSTGRSQKDLHGSSGCGRRWRAASATSTSSPNTSPRGTRSSRGGSRRPSSRRDRARGRSSWSTTRRRRPMASQDHQKRRRMVGRRRMGRRRRRRMVRLPSKRTAISGSPLSTCRGCGSDAENTVYCSKGFGGFIDISVPSGTGLVVFGDGGDMAAVCYHSSQYRIQNLQQATTRYDSQVVGVREEARVEDEGGLALDDGAVALGADAELAAALGGLVRDQGALAVGAEDGLPIRGEERVRGARDGVLLDAVLGREKAALEIDAGPLRGARDDDAAVDEVVGGEDADVDRRRRQVLDAFQVDEHVGDGRRALAGEGERDRPVLLDAHRPQHRRWDLVARHLGQRARREVHREPRGRPVVVPAVAYFRDAQRARAARLELEDGVVGNAARLEQRRRGGECRVAAQVDLAPRRPPSDRVLRRPKPAEKGRLGQIVLVRDLGHPVVASVRKDDRGGIPRERAGGRERVELHHLQSFGRAVEPRVLAVLDRRRPVHAEPRRDVQREQLGFRDELDAAHTTRKRMLVAIPPQRARREALAPIRRGDDDAVDRQDRPLGGVRLHRLLEECRGCDRVYWVRSFPPTTRHEPLHYGPR